jgi:hypothetical protein
MSIPNWLRPDYGQPGDLCRFALEIASARDGKSEKDLSQRTAQTMLTIEKAPSGLGFIIEGEGADSASATPAGTRDSNATSSISGTGGSGRP